MNCEYILKNGDKCSKTTPDLLCKQHTNMVLQNINLLKTNIINYYSCSILNKSIEQYHEPRKIRAADIITLLLNQCCKCSNCNKFITHASAYLLKNDVSYKLNIENSILVCKKCNSKLIKRSPLDLEFN